MTRHLSDIGENELALLLRSANAELAQANALRQARVDDLHAVQAEIARRKDARTVEEYDARRRTAAARGEAPPAPPKAVAAAVRQPLRAAGARLASLSLGSVTPDPVPAPSSRVAAIEPEIPQETGVSDHAVVRYLERVVGFDVEALRRRILTPTVEAAIRSGVTRIRTADGVIVVRQGLVTSYLPRENGPARRKGGKRIRDHERSDVRPREADLLRDWQE